MSLQDDVLYPVCGDGEVAEDFGLGMTLKETNIVYIAQFFVTCYLCLFVM